MCLYIALIHFFRFMSDTRNPRMPSCGPQILFLPQCVWPSVYYGSHGLLQSFQEPELFSEFHVLYLQYDVSSVESIFRTHELCLQGSLPEYVADFICHQLDWKYYRRTIKLMQIFNDIICKSWDKTCVKVICQYMYTVKTHS